MKVYKGDLQVVACGNCGRYGLGDRPAISWRDFVEQGDFTMISYSLVKNDLVAAKCEAQEL